MREIRTSGSVGARGGKPPWATQRPEQSWVPNTEAGCRAFPPCPQGCGWGQLGNCARISLEMEDVM
jgi:hypothetical protein